MVLCEAEPSRNHITAADIEGDGDVDLFFRSLVGSNLWINDGTGSYSLAVNGPDARAFRNNAGSVALCDLDNDGDLDAVWTDGPSNYVYEQVSSNNFTEVTTLDVGAIDDVVCGDVDNDGLVDLFVSSAFAGDQVLYNTGSMSFCPGDHPMIGEGLGRGGALFDADGDGDLDLVVNDDTAGVTFHNNTLNNANYLMVDVITYANASSGRPAVGATVAVYNADGRCGPLLSVSGGSGLGSFPASRLHLGLGTCGGPDTLLHLVGVFPTGIQSVVDHFVRPADFGSDYQLHVMCDTEDCTGDKYATLCSGNITLVEDGASPLSLASSDKGGSAFGFINGDTCIDVVVADATATRLYYGDCDGDFVEQFPSTLGSGSFPNVILADLNSDGAVDIIRSSATDVEVFLNEGLLNSYTVGELAADYTYSSLSSSSSCVALDYNVDGNPDFICTHDDDPVIFEGDGTGNSFTTVAGSTKGISLSGGGGDHMAAGDLDGDGDVDLVFRRSSSNALLINDGSGTYSSSFLSPPSYSGEWALVCFCCVFSLVCEFVVWGFMWLVVCWLLRYCVLIVAVVLGAHPCARVCLNTCSVWVSLLTTFCTLTST